MYLNCQILCFGKLGACGVLLSSKRHQARWPYFFTFLFILIMERLSKMLQKSRQLHWIEGFKIVRNDWSQATVLHLLYVDYTLVFCGAERSQVIHLNLTCLFLKLSQGYTLTWDDWKFWEEVGHLADAIPRGSGLDHWSIKLSRTTYTVGQWKGIRKLWSTFAQNTNFAAGNGFLIGFCKNKWLGNSNIQEAFLNLFTFAQDPDVVIAPYREGADWNLQLRTDLYDWEFCELLDLYTSLQQRNLSPSVADRLKCGNQAGGIFSVKLSYQKMCSCNPMLENWPWKLIKIPPKVSSFTWTDEECLTQSIPSQMLYA